MTMVSRLASATLTVFCIGHGALAAAAQAGTDSSTQPSKQLQRQLNRAIAEMALPEPVPYEQYKVRLGKSIRDLAEEVEGGVTNVLGAPEPAFAYCLPNRYGVVSTALCLNGRFLVAAAANNPFDAAGAFPAYGVHLTSAAGYLFFLDPTNPEVVIKEINGCFVANPSSHWIFAAGLTNFEVAIIVEDLYTGIQRSYHNNAGATFSTIIDQGTPFPCP